jgi:hypothetical protein
MGLRNEDDVSIVFRKQSLRRANLKANSVPSAKAGKDVII